MSCYVKSYFPEHLILSLLLLISLVTCQQHQQVNQQQLNQQQLNQQQQQQVNQQQANQQQLNQQQLNQQQQQQQQYQQQVNQQQVNQQVNQQQYQQNNQQQVNQQQYQQNNQQQQQHGQQQQRFGDQKNVQDAEHINQHLEGQIGTDTSKMSPEQLQFHYFKIHDANDDNMLDGIELLHALTHVHGVDRSPPNIPSNVFSDPPNEYGPSDIHMARSVQQALLAPPECGQPGYTSRTQIESSYHAVAAGRMASIESKIDKLLTNQQLLIDQQTKMQQAISLLVDKQTTPHPTSGALIFPSWSNDDSPSLFRTESTSMESPRDSTGPHTIDNNALSSVYSEKSHSHSSVPPVRRCLQTPSTHSLDDTNISLIKKISTSRYHFAKNLMRRVYSTPERKGRNCRGVKKLALSPARLEYVRKITESRYLTSEAESNDEWQKCIVAIDANLRKK